MKIKSIIITIAVLIIAANASAAFNVYGDNTSTTIYTGDLGTSVGGLALYNNSLYFGASTNINQLNLAGNTVSTVGTVPQNAGNSIVAVNNGTVYTSYGSSYTAPYPYQMGYIDQNGTYVNQLSMDGIYDMAINSQGECFFTANPGAASAQIFKYDFDTGAATLFADVGGYTGGLAFDSQDNLYYSYTDLTDGQIMKYSYDSSNGTYSTAAQNMMDFKAGYIGFDENDNLYATWLDDYWNSTLSQFDLAEGTKIEDIAGAGVGKFTIDGDSIFAINTEYIYELNSETGNYDYMGSQSTIQQVTVVPEPASMALMLLGSALIAKRRKK